MHDLDLHIFPIRWTELSKLTAKQKTFFAVLCFAISEVNALRRLVLFAMNSSSDNVNIAGAARIQQFVLARTLSSKLYEFLKFFDRSLEKSKSDPKLPEILTMFKSEIDIFKSGTGFDIAQQIRDKMDNHYDFGMTKKVVESISEDFDCSLFLNEKEANSYYPLGEHILFGAGLGQIRRDNGTSIQNKENLDAWIDWNFEVSDLMNRMHLKFFEVVVDPCFPNRETKHAQEVLELELVGDIDNFRLPLFVRESS